MKTLAAAFMLVSATAMLVHANVEVTARVTPTEITVGDPVVYEITVTHPADARVELPSVRGNVGSMEVLGYTVRGDSGQDGQRRVTHALTLAAYEVGTDTLPPQRIEIRTRLDTAATILYTNPTALTVKASTPKDAKDIAEIHDEDRLPRSIPWGLPILLAAVAAAIWTYRIWKRRRALRPVIVVTAPPPTIGEAALARLDALEAERLVAANRFREFAFALSEILRQYLANRFGIDALEATTAELLERAGSLPLSNERPFWLRDFCEELDAVKFADGTFTVADEARLLTETRAMIRATLPTLAEAVP